MYKILAAVDRWQMVLYREVNEFGEFKLATIVNYNDCAETHSVYLSLNQLRDIQNRIASFVVEGEKRLAEEKEKERERALKEKFFLREHEPLLVDTGVNHHIDLGWLKSIPADDNKLATVHTQFGVLLYLGNKQTRTGQRAYRIWLGSQYGKSYMSFDEAYQQAEAEWKEEVE